jgi:aryl-alcohol dehydrogenase-like predicted oxidoreductase
VTRRPSRCRSCASWASASSPTHRSATASSPARSAPPSRLADDDWRKSNPRFSGENFQRNLRIVDEVEAVASEAGATPAQVALAWLLAHGDDIAPIPGTKRVSRVEENTAADALELSAEQIERLNNLTPAAGERHEEAQMATIDR